MTVTIKPHRVTTIPRISDAHSEATLFMTVGQMTDPYVYARFTVDGEPVTKSRARYSGSTRSFYTPRVTTQAEQKVAAAFMAVRPATTVPESTFGVICIFHIKTRQRRDVDNMIKLVMDGLTGVAWNDDSQVSEVTGRKVGCADGHPRTEVLLYLTPRTWEKATAKCVLCGKEYSKPPSWKNKEFCTSKCRSESLRRRREKTCGHCGKTFDHNNANSAQYCSKACTTAAKQIPATCAHCAKDFTKPRHLNRAGRSYCSKECQVAYWRENRPKRPAGTCQDCGGGVSRKEYKRCQACHQSAGGIWGTGARKKPEVES